MNRENVSEREWLAERFEEHRRHLRAVAYRMLGSLNEADDAVQEAWLRLSRQDAAAIDNLGGWLTTVVARICLSNLKARRSRREELMGVRVPDPVVRPIDASGPDQEALLADSVGLALLVVLDQLSPPERLAFVLHDMFGVPFREIAPILGRSPTAARQLASRARRRVKGQAALPDPDLARQQEAVDAFMAAAREGNFEALVAVLDPDVVLRADTGAQLAGVSREIRGAEAVAGQALSSAHLDLQSHRALVNGAPGAVTFRGGRPFSVAGFTARDGKIIEIDILANPERLRHLDLTALER